MKMFATIWRADSPLARCRNCGAMQQNHGRPNFTCTAFEAETAADIEPYDLSPEDLVREITRLGYPVGARLTGWTATDADIERTEKCRLALRNHISTLTGVDFEDLTGSLLA